MRFSLKGGEKKKMSCAEWMFCGLCVACTVDAHTLQHIGVFFSTLIVSQSSLVCLNFRIFYKKIIYRYRHFTDIAIKANSSFYASFVRRSSQWQQCICRRHVGSASRSAIVLSHKTNGSTGVYVVVVPVTHSFGKVCSQATL